jgi:DNA-directed RNA polymerase subunit RPC12/RpoP
MVKHVYKAICQADVIVHYNGTSFDEPHLNREFLEAGLHPPSKPETVDLYLAIGRKFRFASKKLQHAADVLKLRQGKIRTDFTLWSRVLDGDKNAQAEMEKYNREDVELTAALYHRVLPWIDKHPNAGLYENDTLMRCTHCGSENLVKDGLQRTSSGIFQRYRCRDCGARSRGLKRTRSTPLRESR